MALDKGPGASGPQRTTPASKFLKGKQQQQQQQQQQQVHHKHKIQQQDKER